MRIVLDLAITRSDGTEALPSDAEYIVKTVIVPALLARPVGAALHTADGRVGLDVEAAEVVACGEATIEVCRPFLAVQDHRVLIPVEVDGRPGELVLDDDTAAGLDTLLWPAVHLVRAKQEADAKHANADEYDQALTEAGIANVRFGKLQAVVLSTPPL